MESWYEKIKDELSKKKEESMKKLENQFNKVYPKYDENRIERNKEKIELLQEKIYSENQIFKKRIKKIKNSNMNITNYYLKYNYLRRST